jgi:glycogen debranching enzyme
MGCKGGESGEDDNVTGGEPLTLPIAGDSERLVRARGAMFIVTTHQGDVTPAGARELGLIYKDTRFLSHYELEVVSCRTVSLGADTSHPAYNQVDLMLSDPEREELLEDPSNFLHIRRRQALDGGLVEEIVFTNFLLRPCEIRVVLRFGADFADVFEVRGARRAKRGTTSSKCGAQGARSEARITPRASKALPSCSRIPASMDARTRQSCRSAPRPRSSSPTTPSSSSTCLPTRTRPSK